MKFLVGCLCTLICTYGIATEINSFLERYALITGATRGLGKSIVEELIKKEPTLKIFAVARTEKDLKQLFEEYPLHIIPITADLSKNQDLKHIVQVVHSTLFSHGTLAYVIHNAALIEPIGDLHYLEKQPLESLASLMEASYKVNVIAPHLLTLGLLSELTTSNSSRILFISSAAGEQPVLGGITYSCTKAAMDHLAWNLKVCIPKSIAIGVVHPGVVDTDMHATLRTYPVEQLSFASKFRIAKENNELIAPFISAQFMIHLLYDISAEEFSSKKWNLYFTRPNNFPDWLSDRIGSAPYYIPKVPQKTLKGHQVFISEDP